MSTICLKRQGSTIGKSFTRFKSHNSKNIYSVLLGIAGATAATAYFYKNRNNNNNNGGSNKKLSPLLGSAAIVNAAKTPHIEGFNKYQEVYNAIAEKVREEDDYDDGAGRYGLLCRLSWHTSGTYDKSTNTGGSYGGTMIYSPEAIDGENAGLEAGRDFLYEFKDKFPWISRGDLWTLGGVVAVQEAGGPKIPWRPGREDILDRNRIPENGRLPDASQNGEYVRDLFARMGFNERETVALIGAHCLGQCHAHRSGYVGPWGPSFNMFTNDFFVRLLQNWHVKEWDGKKQWEDDETKSFMMLPTDIALKEEPYFLKYVKMYANDQDLFFEDFSKAFSTLLELGVSYPADSKPFIFKTLDQQEI